MLKINKIVTILWFITICSLALAFPLQVYAMNPYPSLIPYFFFFLIWMLESKKNKKTKKSTKSITQNRMDNIIKIYLFLILFHFLFRLIFGINSPSELMSFIVNYAFPSSFYFYFRDKFLSFEIQIILKAIICSSIFIAIYYVYDNYSMIVMGKVNEYSKMVIEYTQLRQNVTDPNEARIWAFNRGQGLLERASVSVFWIAMGAFASLTIIPLKNKFTRVCIVVIYMLFILISLNFTSMAAFFIAIILVEFKGFDIFFGKLSKNNIKYFVFLSILFTVIIVETTIYLDIASFDRISSLFQFQTEIISGSEYKENRTFIGNFFHTLFSFPIDMLISFPPGLIIGETFLTGLGSAKGGDYGMIETIRALGPILYFIIVIGIFRLVKSSLKLVFSNSSIDNKENSYLFFAICFFIYLFIAELHYSVWNSKSVLPILFICVGILYQSSKKQKTIDLSSPN